MMKRRDERTRERERKRYETEARKTFGVAARLEGVNHDATRTMADTFDDERRLTTVHDPTKPSACRLCGVTVAPTTHALSGWKCCDACRALIPGGLAAVWGELLDTTITHPELQAMLTRGVTNPSYYFDRWSTAPGHEHRWAHVDADTVDMARSILAAVRVEQRAASTPRRNSYGTGCAWCGVARSLHRTDTPWRFGRGPHAPRAAACADCAPWVARSGAHGGYEGDWHAHLLAACIGMKRPQWDLTFDLRAFCESGADPAGTDEPWQYLGAVRAQVRARIVRELPRFVTLTPQEKRVMKMERAIAAATAPDDRPPLASV